MTSNRPYRVGMARPAQRYIEPDEIYEDMKRGASTQIPREFGWSWNPVNGLGGTAGARIGVSGLSGAQMGGILEDTFSAIANLGKGAISAGSSAAQDQGKQAVLDALNRTPAGKALLDTVQQKAAEGVTDVVKKQGTNLILLAVAAGSVGGALSAKLGKTGTILAIGVAGWAALQLLNAVTPPVQK